MRRRIVRVAVITAAVGLLLFAVPLGVVVRATLLADQRRALESAALEAAVRVGPTFSAGDPVELPSGGSIELGVYDNVARLRSGRGPTEGDPIVRGALDGQVSDGQVGSDLVVAVPVSAAEVVTGVVRAAQPVDAVRRRVFRAWLALAVLAAFACLVAVQTARAQARRLSRPLENLAGASAKVAAGDLTCRAEPDGVPEIRLAAEAQNRMVDELAAMIDQARCFGADVSHQLRTPLAGLRLALDDARRAAREDHRPDLTRGLDDAVERATALHRIVDDLLELAQRPRARWFDDTVSVDRALQGAEQRWHGPLAADGRRLVRRTERGAEDGPVPRRPVEQIMDVLIDNARRHGRGTVTLRARELGEVMIIEVSDEGTVVPSGPSPRGTGHGLGLGLARALAERCGGRIVLTSADPATFSLLLPVDLVGEVDRAAGRIDGRQLNC